MTTPKAWSYTALSDHTNCPKAFYEKRVIKSVVEQQSEQMLWGNKVHKAFEDYVGSGTPLPDMLQSHQDYLDGLRVRGDNRFTERKVALDKSLKPCTFFAQDTWWRGVLDYHSIQGNTVTIVDYKTGKRKPDFRQLWIFAIWIFTHYPQVEFVRVGFYWTQDREVDNDLLTRDDIPRIWTDLLKDLKPYVYSFKHDIWPAKPSGLCNGWCPVKNCEHWKPKRNR